MQIERIYLALAELARRHRRPDPAPLAGPFTAYELAASASTERPE